MLCIDLFSTITKNSQEELVELTSVNGRESDEKVRETSKSERMVVQREKGSDGLDVCRFFRV